MELSTLTARQKIRTLQNEDTQLIETTLSGDNTAFETLVRKYQDRLFGTLVYIVGNYDDACDVLQDTFVQAYVKLDTFLGNSAFYTWIYRIARNQIVTRRRSFKPTVSLDMLSSTAYLGPVDPGEGPVDQLLRQENRRQLYDALQQIPSKFREVLVLRDIEGHDYIEIGELLSIPVGTVRSRLHRARRQLKELMTEMFAEDPIA